MKREWVRVLPFTPVPASRYGQGSYYSKKYTNYREQVMQYVISIPNFYDGFDEITTNDSGAILSVEFYFKKPKSRKSYAMTVAPDLDNLMKATKDVLFNGREKASGPNEELFRLGKDKDGNDKYMFPRDSIIVGYGQVLKAFTDDDSKVGTFIKLREV